MGARSLTENEMTETRKKTKLAFQKLNDTTSMTSPSWVRSSQSDQWCCKRSNRCQYFDTHGFWVESKFVDVATIQALKKQMEELANNDWNPKENLDTFGTDEKSNQERRDYFLDSSNRVHYFAENTALDEETKQLKPQFQNDKLAALNKAGHGMHIIPGAFQDYSLSNKIKEFVLDLGWKDPVVPQSMYIFKQPLIGGTVTSHQDSSFLFTNPRQTCLGLWLALDDATLENGCLWVRPGSHQEPVRRQFIRNPEYFEKGNTGCPHLIFQSHHDNPTVTWEGSLPESLEQAGFLPVEVKAGDLVAFCGTLDHLSLPNFSSLQRHTFQLHLVEGTKEGISWSALNWLQYPSGAEFMRLIFLNNRRLCQHALVCFGGAGGQHPYVNAHNLDMETIFIHRYYGILSAYGTSFADKVLKRQKAFGVISDFPDVSNLAYPRLQKLDQLTVDELPSQEN